ncbi:endonuclease III domain-containing protein, partial [Staphylococcus aureus]
EGEVPRTRTQLMKLPGVGRKTANVVLAEGFKLPAIAVDTHVERVAKRLKLAKPNDTVEDVERKLMRKIPREDWARAHHLLLLFGRYHSTARNERDAFELLEELKEKHQR